MNLCGDLKGNAPVYFVSQDSTLTIPLISMNVTENDYQLVSTAEAADKLQGFSIELKQKPAELPFKVTLRCDKNATAPVYTNTDDGVEIKTYDACGYINEPARLFATHRYLISVAFIVLGVILLLFGGYKWDMLVSMLAFFVGFGTIFFMFFTFVTFQPQMTSYVIILVIATIVGILLSVICKTFIALSYALIGFAGGYFLARYCIVAFQLALLDWQLLTITYAAAAVFAILCVFLEKRMMIVLSSLVGGIMVSYHIGFLAHVLGNLMELLEKIRSGHKMVF